MDPSPEHLPPKLEDNPAKEYWAEKRKRRRETETDSNEETKAPKLAEDATPSESRPVTAKPSKQNWKNLELSEIKFYSPTIVVDLSFEGQMSHKVRTVDGHFLSLFIEFRTLL